MSGRPRLKLYQYDEKGAFIRAYETQMEVFNKYYDGKKGELFLGKDFRELPDGTYICTYQIGRKLVKEIKIDKNIFCSKRIDDKPVSVYNLRGEKIATFANIRACTEMVKLDYTTIQNRLYRNVRYFPKSEDGLTFKFE